MKEPKCAQCFAGPCREGLTKNITYPSFCPIENFSQLIGEITNKYSNSEIKEFYNNSAFIEKECYDERLARDEGKIMPLRPRIREISEFAKKMGAIRLGMAFCSGLFDEARRANNILENHGFEVVSVMCSSGGIDKTEVGIPSEFKIRNINKFEAACNPLFQAEILNRAKTTFNVIVGLCVGHDMLFTSFSKAPVTTLIVKDRLTGHNPVAALYSRYYKDLV